MISDDVWSKELCEVQTDFKNTPMHVAAMSGLPKYVKLLLLCLALNVKVVTSYRVELWKNFSSMN